MNMNIYKQIKQQDTVEDLRALYQTIVPGFDVTVQEIKDLNDSLENTRTLLKEKRAILKKSGNKKNLRDAFEERLGELTITQLET